MDSERDELIDLIGDASPSIPVKADWECLADAILAAGYRRVDGDSVVVRREHIKTLDNQRGFLWTLWDARSNSRNVDWDDADNYKALTDAMDALSADGDTIGAKESANAERDQRTS